MQSSAQSRRIVPNHQRQDLFIALGAGLVILAFVVFAFVVLSRQAAASGGVKGIIIAKNFLPQQETQITVGRDGVSSRQSAGEYSFQVRVPGEHDKIYKVTVDPLVYRSHEVGGRFYFVPDRSAAR